MNSKKAAPCLREGQEFFSCTHLQKAMPKLFSTISEVSVKALQFLTFDSKVSSKRFSTKQDLSVEISEFLN